MIWLEDKVEIKASPEQIFDWFAHLEENYLAWHPQDHIEWRTLKGNLMEAGSTFYFAERIGGRTLKMKCRITGVEPNRRVEWTAIGPFSLLGVGASSSPSRWRLALFSRLWYTLRGGSRCRAGSSIGRSGRSFPTGSKASGDTWRRRGRT